VCKYCGLRRGDLSAARKNTLLLSDSQITSAGARQAYLEGPWNVDETGGTQTGRFWLYEFPDGVRRARGTAIDEALKRGDISNRDVFFTRDTSDEEIKNYLQEKGLNPGDLELDD